MDIEASKIAILSGVSRQCVNRICLALRKHIATKCEQESQIQGEIEIDESYFGTRRVRGKRGRGVKRLLFGILKRDCANVNSQKLLCQRAFAYLAKCCEA